jgi:hypothetical protein
MSTLWPSWGDAWPPVGFLCFFQASLVRYLERLRFAGPCPTGDGATLRRMVGKDKHGSLRSRKEGLKLHCHSWCLVYMEPSESLRLWECQPQFVHHCVNCKWWVAAVVLCWGSRSFLPPHPSTCSHLVCSQLAMCSPSGQAKSLL